VAEHGFVQLDGPLELAQQLRLRVELHDDVVADLLALDGVGERALAPVTHGGHGVRRFRALEECVEALEPLVDLRLFQRAIEDVDQLVLTDHGTILWAVRPRPVLGGVGDMAATR
jgi:hypothetical protein